MRKINLKLKEIQKQDGRKKRKLLKDLTKEELLENKTRNDIYNLILKNEGIHFRDIQAKSKKSAGVIIFHINILLEHKIISPHKDGKYKRFFINPKYDQVSRIIISNLRKKTMRDTIKYLLKNKKIKRYKELSSYLGVSNSAINPIIKKLKQDNLISIKKDQHEIVLNEKKILKIKQILEEIGKI